MAPVGPSVPGVVPPGMPGPPFAPGLPPVPGGPGSPFSPENKKEPSCYSKILTEVFPFKGHKVSKDRKSRPSK